jgi:hypothetical protein
MYPILTISSERNIRNYLINKGYFNASVKSGDSEGQKGRSSYHVELNQPYIIRNFQIEAKILSYIAISTNDEKF